MRIAPIALAVALVTLVTRSPAAADIAGGTFAPTGSDVTPRFFHCAGLLDDGTVLVTGGMRLQLVPPSLVTLSEISRYDPVTEQFTASSATLATPRSGHTQSLVGGIVVIAGGRTGAADQNPGTPVASVELYDPGADTIAPGPPMSEPRADHTATILPDGRLVVAGGATWQLYDPAIGDWSAPVALTHARTSHAAVALPDHAGPNLHRVLVLGGAGGGPTTMELLDPFAGTSTLVAATLDVGVDDLAACRLDDGRVLITGGQSLAGGDTVDLVYRFDPASDAITVMPPLPDAPDGVADHALVPLGRFAVVLGGEQQVGGVDTELDYAAIFDNAFGTWIFVTSMTFAHDDLAAVALPDDRILVVDGGIPFLGQELPTNNVELFVPQPADRADLNCDGVVDVLDLIVVVVQWGDCPAPPEACAADLDGDGAVGVPDLIEIIVNWG